MECTPLPGKLSEEESISLFYQHVDWLKMENGDPPDLTRVTYHGDLQKAWDFRKARLQTADLRGALLAGANFSQAHLKEARLEWAHMEGANLSSAQLQAATLAYAHLEEATLRGASLANARLDGASLANANLDEADLTQANLSSAHLENAKIIGANLVEANLVDANFEGADLAASNLAGAALWGTNLSRADLRGVQGLLLNSTVVRHARFSPWASDPWSVLRRNYTGGKFLFHLLFLVMFLLVYGVKIMFWVGVNQGQVALVSEQNKLNAELKELAIELQSQNDILAKQNGIKIPKLKALVDKVADNLKITVQPCLAKECVKQSVAAALVRWHDGWLFWATALAIVTYNCLRGVMTWIMTPLRDEEERSGHTPPYGFGPPIRGRWTARYAWDWLWARLEVYGWLIYCHRVATVLLWVSVGSLLFHGWNILFNTDVWLPQR